MSAAFTRIGRYVGRRCRLRFVDSTQRHEQFGDPREYSTEMLVEPTGPLVGKSIEQAGLRSLPNTFLAEIERNGEILAAVAPETILRIARRVCSGGDAGKPCTADSDCTEGTCSAPIFDFGSRALGGIGPVVVSATQHDLEARDPVPLDALIETPNLFAFVVPEPLTGTGDS